jgi:hypothetical protein
MPSYAIHLIVLDKAVEKLRVSGHNAEADLLAKYGDYSALGAMGPDIYFFAPDMDAVTHDLINFIFEVYDVLEPFIDFYKDYVEPVMDEAEAGVDWLTGGLWTSLKESIAQISATVFALLAKVTTQQFDLFQHFEPNMNKGLLEKNWFWIEMGHGRRTNQFASNLLQGAKNDPALKAYACGYLTHIMTDVIGHPFVNQIVGGPFRTQWHRHHLIENFMDSWAWQNYYNANILEAKLDQRMAFGDRDLPPGLSALIDTTFQKTYPNDHKTYFQLHVPKRIGQASYLSQDDINETYRLFRSFLEMATSRGIMSMPAPVPPVLIPGLNNIISSPPNSSGSSFSWSALWNWIKWIFETIGKILTLPAHILASLGTYGLRYALYLVTKLLYQAYRDLRWTLVLGGYLMPEPDDLLSNYGIEFTTQRQPIPSQRYNNLSYPYPMLEYDYLQISRHQIYYPFSGSQYYVEKLMTESSPYPVGAHPDYFIEKAIRNNAATAALMNAQQSWDTEFTNQATINTGQLGNAVDWCAELIVKAANNNLSIPADLPDWNLDSDRGYGWLNWYWKPYDQNMITKNFQETFYFKNLEE